MVRFVRRGGFMFVCVLFFVIEVEGIWGAGPQMLH